MKSIDELVAEQQNKRQSELERKALASDVGTKVGEATSRSSDSMMGEMKKGFKVTNLHEAPAPKTDVSINFSGLEKLDVDTVVIAGLVEAMDSIASKFEKLNEHLEIVSEDIKRIEFNPTFEVPESKVKVELPDFKIPPITIPKPEVNVTNNVDVTKFNSAIEKIKVLISDLKKEPKLSQEVVPKLVSYQKMYKGNRLDGLIETYSDGSVIKSSGMSTGKTTYEY